MLLLSDQYVSDFFSKKIRNLSIHHIPSHINTSYHITYQYIISHINRSYHIAYQYHISTHRITLHINITYHISYHIIYQRIISHHVSQHASDYITKQRIQPAPGLPCAKNVTWREEMSRRNCPKMSIVLGNPMGV